MVHRADSRLLSNLLQHEKEYTKQLLTLLDTSNASLNSLAAYAAASPQPLGHVIMAVVGSLAAADDALRRYAQSVELWRETMARLKDMEDEVGNVIRDREILVTRLIKASKSSKPGSGIAASVRSSSSLSLSKNQDAPSSRPLSLVFSTSSKLSAAQSELQACEQHLAAKEHELANSRSAALREGLGARLKALIDCGWAWGEFGKGGLRSLEALQPDSNVGDDGHNLKGTDTDSFFVNASSEDGISSISPSQSASQINHDHHDTRPPVFHSFRSVELLPAPPLTAELSTTTVRPISMATTNTATTSGTLSGSGTSTPAHAALLAATTSTLTYAPAVAVHIPPSSPPSALGVNETEVISQPEVHLLIPPPHALGPEYVDIPVAEMVDVVKARLGEVAGSRSSSRSSLSDKTSRQDEQQTRQRVVHLMEKRITEEGSIVERDDETEHVHNVQGGNLHGDTPQTVELQVAEPVQEQRATIDTKKEANTEDGGHNRKAIHDPESSSDEARAQKLEVVENPRFMSEKQRREAEEQTKKLAGGKAREAEPLDSSQSPQTQAGVKGATVDKNAKTSPSKTFFGSLRGFFGTKDRLASPAQSASRSKQKSRATAADSSNSDSSSDDDDWPSPTAKKRKKVLKTLLFRPSDKKTASTGAKLELGRGSLDSWNESASGLGSGIGGRSPTRGKIRAESSGTTKGDSERLPAAVDADNRAGVTAASIGGVKAGSVDRLELSASGKQGNHKGRTRASSDVGTSAGGGSQSRLLQRPQTVRRLKKTRAVIGGGVVERSGSSGSDLEVGGSGSKLTKPVPGLGGPPVAGSAVIAKATWLKDYSIGRATPPFGRKEDLPLTEGPSTSKRSNSVDIGVASRRKERRESYVLIDHPDKDVHRDGEESPGSPTPSSSKGQIIDLGERRAREKEKITSNPAVLKSVSSGAGKVPSRSSSLSTPRKATTVLTLRSNEEGPVVSPDRRLSRDSSFRTKGETDVGKTRRTDTLGQSSFNSAAARSSMPISVANQKSTPGTASSPTSKTPAAPVPTSASLMSIVEGVKRSREAAAAQITSGSAKSGTMAEVVKAPPRTNREDLENFAGHRDGGEKGEDKVAASALFQIQAPGSVFDQKHQASTGNAGSKGSSSTPSPSTSALGIGTQQRGQAVKTPLKSALKNASRTPSPSPLVVSAPLPLAASASVPKGSAITNGVTHLAAPLTITGQGLAESESAYESGEEEFFTDEGEPESTLANGHVKVEESPAVKSERTTVRTVLPTPNDQSPRKRKSVRVSLKPTFSPSPPAIEYDEEENSHVRGSSHYFQKPVNHHPPGSSKPTQIPSHGGGRQNGKWEDSSDEDEEYKSAKAALSRAARKDKEVTSTFGH